MLSADPKWATILEKLNDEDKESIEAEAQGKTEGKIRLCTFVTFSHLLKIEEKDELLKEVQQLIDERENGEELTEEDIDRIWQEKMEELNDEDRVQYSMHTFSRNGLAPGSHGK